MAHRSFAPRDLEPGFLSLSSIAAWFIDRPEIFTLLAA